MAGAIHGTGDGLRDTWDSGWRETTWATSGAAHSPDDRQCNTAQGMGGATHGTGDKQRSTQPGQQRRDRQCRQWAVQKAAHVTGSMRDMSRSWTRVIFFFSSPLVYCAFTRTRYLTRYLTRDLGSCLILGLPTLTGLAYRYLVSLGLV